MEKEKASTNLTTNPVTGYPGSRTEILHAVQPRKDTPFFVQWFPGKYLDTSEEH